MRFQTPEQLGEWAAKYNVQSVRFDPIDGQLLGVRFAAPEQAPTVIDLAAPPEQTPQRRAVKRAFDTILGGADEST